MIVRPAIATDAAEIQAIYAHHVLNGTGTFEETPPSREQMVQRMADVADRGLPWIVAEEQGRIAGYAYASPFRLRSAYRFTAEDSVYVAPGEQGRGVGRTALAEVVRACEALGLRQLLAVIGDSSNTASIGVHRSLGFDMIGVSPGLGFKQGRFLDVVFMQKALNGGTQGAPTVPGLLL
ncbi:MAG: N-acetyltransferase family protein [Alphaproteobacteria bacterium]